MRGRLWAASGRARFIVDHPMDTGLAGDIPVFIIEDLALETDDGVKLARIELSEPVNEDPAFTLYFAPGTLPASLHVRGRDNNGNDIDGVISQGALN